MIPDPYLLYLGSSTDGLSVKTARGIAVWRPELCVGEIRGRNCGVSIGLPELTLDEAVAKGARTLIIGFANAGGFMTDETVEQAIAALHAGLNVASGLHQRLSSHPGIRVAAEAAGLKLFDVREPPPNLTVGTGAPRAGHRLLTVGTDCSVGKMYTTLALEREMHARGIAADFRATGQTGIFIAGAGVPVDAVVADFISGAVESISPAREDGGWDLIEGQGSLFHPSFAGVSLGLLHGAQPDALVLCHQGGRAGIRMLNSYPIPDLQLCLDRNLEAARLTNPKVVPAGVALNTALLDADAAKRTCAEIEDRLGLPCQDPVAMGVDRIVERLLQCVPYTPA